MRERRVLLYDLGDENVQLLLPRVRPLPPGKVLLPPLLDLRAQVEEASLVQAGDEGVG